MIELHFLLSYVICYTVDGLSYLVKKSRENGRYLQMTTNT